jgi:hypothetical protein
MKAFVIIWSVADTMPFKICFFQKNDIFRLKVFFLFLQKLIDRPGPNSLLPQFTNIQNKLERLSSTAFPA